ncbi:MAG: methionyl-tRNA formyltransferase [Verrucomicrobiota bacterium]
MPPLRLVFLGTGDIALPTFERLLELPGVELLGLVTQPDKPVGRKQVLTPPRLKTLALEAGLEVRQPHSLRKEPTTLEGWGADLYLVMAYGQILPKMVLDRPRLACLNLHASLLPKHRGASPIQAALLAGDTESGLTVIFMDEGLDTGDILLQESLPLAPDETGSTLHDRLAELAPIALEKALVAFQEGPPPRRPQENSQATHLGKLTREHGRLDWTQPAQVLERQIRAFHPWPGSRTSYQVQGKPKQLKIFPPASVEELATPTPPGTLLVADRTGLCVACGQNALRLTQLQPEGKRRMDVASFLAGHSLQSENRLGN